MKKNVLSPINLHGIYIPYWIYDAKTRTKYVGSRGDRYTHKIKNKDGSENLVTRISWNYTSGEIFLDFDDILIPASKTVSSKILKELSPWETNELSPMDNKYLKGFISEKYKIELEDGFNYAEYIIEKEIKKEIRKDIGGDVQMIDSMNIKCENITFKHALFPVYISYYMHRGKKYQFYLNGKNRKSCR